MATFYGYNYDTCKSYVLRFLGAEDEASLYHLELKSESEAVSTSIRHVIRNAKRVEVVDIVWALTTVAGVVAATANPIAFCLGAVNAGLFFIKNFRRARTVKLDPADAAIVWALNRLGNHASRDDLLREWKKVVDESSGVEAATTETKLNARLAELEKLGCLFTSNGEIAFAEEITRA